jgi:hypothetical protein
VAHTYDHSNSGGGEIRSIAVQSQSWQKVYKTISQKKKKKAPQKWAGGVAEGVGPEFKPQYHTQKNVKPSEIFLQIFNQNSSRSSNLLFSA